VSHVLDDADLATALAALPRWRIENGMLVREIVSPTFADGIRLVGAVAVAADEADHHPDIDIRWTKVTLRLVTHSAGGITDKDLAMAARIDQLTD
jgi:4a-hydroxytetrahydrobiopterin dehydratase